MRCRFVAIFVASLLADSSSLWLQIASVFMFVYIVGLPIFFLLLIREGIRRVLLPALSPCVRIIIKLFPPCRSIPIMLPFTRNPRRMRPGSDQPCHHFGLNTGATLGNARKHTPLLTSRE